jgi:hypothetical protein
MTYGTPMAPSEGRKSAAFGSCSRPRCRPLPYLAQAGSRAARLHFAGLGLPQSTEARLSATCSAAIPSLNLRRLAKAIWPSPETTIFTNDGMTAGAEHGRPPQELTHPQDHKPHTKLRSIASILAPLRPDLLNSLGSNPSCTLRSRENRFCARKPA